MRTSTSTMGKERDTVAGNTDYKRNFNAQNYDRMEITVPKGDKAKIKDFASQRGKSLNGFVNEALKEKMERDATAETPPSGE